MTQPATFLVGQSELYYPGLNDYLDHTGQQNFGVDVNDALMGSSDHPPIKSGMILCSLMAKLCYKSLVPGKNENISKTRAIPHNLKAAFAHGHGSVFRHCVLNFITTGCSRVFTHELVRHSAGTAFSQTSGRYVRSDQLEMVLDDPILELRTKDGTSIRRMIESEAGQIQDSYNGIVGKVDWDSLSMQDRKKLTSALRRILPNGQSNEIGWSANICALRHMIMMRTSEHAEWEIRYVFNQVYKLLKEHMPIAVYDAEATVGEDGLLNIVGMKTQPY